MAKLEAADIAIIWAVLLGMAAHYITRAIWDTTKHPGATVSSASHVAAGAIHTRITRNFIKKMEEMRKNCIIFYGSQTGTAEDYAFRLAREGKSRYGLETMIADLEEYDFENLGAFPEDKVIIFILATYGEGEPTDNAEEFYEFIMTEEATWSDSSEPPLDNLHYVAFGLGNNTYENYNSMVRNVDKALTCLGAHRIGEAGEGDDGTGTMEEDFLAWKDPMWTALAKRLDLAEHESEYDPAFSIAKHPELTAESPEVYLGEPNKTQLGDAAEGLFNAQNPIIADVASSYELCRAEGRSCIHMEIDISKSDLSYQTGDHIAVWPTNAGDEVDRLLQILGLADSRNTVISVKPLDLTAKSRFPNPTTYDTILRYHLEICAPVSRQLVATLAAFAPNDTFKAEMARLGSDKDYFHSFVNAKLYNLASFLSQVSKGQLWQIPLSAVIEGLNQLQPRYYSISSSALVQPKKISITAVVETQAIPGRDQPFRGVATHYIHALQQKQNQTSQVDPYGASYALAGPRRKYNGIQLPVHFRRSSFKLPSDPSSPIIMVGPGTGVAPFRAFVQERARLAADGAVVGKMLLFFGCRNSKEDFLYEKEWAEYQRVLGKTFQMVVAFSRETKKKVYVQHCLKEMAQEVNELLHKKAFFYVCGDAARMAREVNTVLGQIIAECRGISRTMADDVIKRMRAANRYQEDVWS